MIFMIDCPMPRSSHHIKSQVLSWLAVLGITSLLVAITIQFLPRASSPVNMCKRNAQNIASVYASAIAGGIDEFPSGDNLTGADLDTVIALLQKGVTYYGYATATFQIPKLSAEEIQCAKRHLKIDGGEIAVVRYVADPRF